MINKIIINRLEVKMKPAKKYQKYTQTYGNQAIDFSLEWMIEINIYD